MGLLRRNERARAASIWLLLLLLLLWCSQSVLYLSSVLLRRTSRLLWGSAVVAKPWGFSQLLLLLLLPILLLMLLLVVVLRPWWWLLLLGRPWWQLLLFLWLLFLLLGSALPCVLLHVRLQLPLGLLVVALHILKPLCASSFSAREGKTYGNVETCLRQHKWLGGIIGHPSYVLEAGSTTTSYFTLQHERDQRGGIFNH